MTTPLCKRPKIKDTRVIDNSNEHFSGINKIEYSNSLDIPSETLLYYRYYNHAEKINGHNIDEWLTFIINFKSVYEKPKVSNTFEKLKSSLAQPWDDGTSTIENYKRQIRAFYELLLKLGMKYWTTAVEDIIPPCETIEEIFRHYDEITDYINDLHKRTGIKLIWLSTNFPFLDYDGKSSNTTDQAQIFSLYGQQIKKAIEMAQKLNTDGFIINYPADYKNITCVDTSVQVGLKNYAKMLKMIMDYKDYIGFRGELFIGINKRFMQDEISVDHKNNYIFDAFSTLCFLKHYNLDKHFRIKVQTPHELLMISEYMGNVGSIELHSTPTIQCCVTIMKSIFDNGILHNPPAIIINGLSLKCNDYKNVFEDFIANIDTYAAALHIVFKMYSDGIITKNAQSYTTMSASFPNSLKECDEQARKMNTTQLFKHISPHNLSHKRHCDILLERLKSNL